MVILIECAGYGLALHSWSLVRQDEPSILEVGRQRAMREEGGFSYRNAHVLEVDDQVAGLILGYRLADPYETGDLSQVPPEFRALVELESLVPGSWYLNVLAVHAEFRGRGLGSRLLSKTAQIASEAQAASVSLIFESGNESAARLYAHHGYVEKARRPRQTFPGDLSGSQEWVLASRAI